MGGDGKKRSFSSLVRLDLSKNTLETLDEKAFCSHDGSYAIEYLDLSANPIKSLDPCIFTALGKMTLVYYSNNSTSASKTAGTNCNCDTVNYLSGFKVKLISDCDLDESTKCSRVPPQNSTMCMDKAKYACGSNRNLTSKFMILFIVFLTLFF